MRERLIKKYNRHLKAKRAKDKKVIKELTFKNL